MRLGVFKFFNQNRTDAPPVFDFDCLDKFSGDHSGGETPLPIPNRVVKPACADGTAFVVGEYVVAKIYLKTPVSDRGFFLIA